MKTITATKACQACIHWNHIQEELGECRRHAPQNIAFEIDDELRVESRFPATSAEDWCGDFTLKD